MNGECAGKVALVTGASRGIGAAIARRLASAGAAVAAVARSLDSHPPDLPGTLRETVAAIEAQGGRAMAIQGDVMDAGSRAQVVARCREVLGPIDILVNNAVYAPPGSRRGILRAGLRADVRGQRQRSVAPLSTRAPGNA